MENDFRKADIPEKDLAMLGYAEKVTGDPCRVTRGDFDKLKKAGFKDAEILDVVQVISYFNYVNRMACGLGVALEPYWED